MNNQYCKNYLMHAQRVNMNDVDWDALNKSWAAASVNTRPNAPITTMEQANAVTAAAEKRIDAANKRMEGQANRRRMLAINNDTSAGSTTGAIKSTYKSLIGPDGKFDKKKYNAMYYELHKALWAPGGKYYEAAQKVKNALSGAGKLFKTNKNRGFSSAEEAQQHYAANNWGKR